MYEVQNLNKVAILWFGLVAGILTSVPGHAAEFRTDLLRHLNATHGDSAMISVVNRQGVNLFTVSTDPERKRSLTPDSVMRVASVSKVPIALAAIIELRQQGIDLQATLKSIAPELNIENPFRDGKEIRLVHLLEHTSGIQEMIAPWLAETNSFLPIIDLIRKRFPRAEVRWPPGTTPTYSNFNYIALNHVIEKVSGKPFDQIIKEHVFLPLGMSSSTFRKIETPAIVPGFFPGTGDRIFAIDGPYRAAAGLYTSAADLARLLQGLLQLGEFDAKPVFDPLLLRFLATPATSLAAQDGLELGHGPGVVSRQTNGRVYAGHNGMIDGYSARMYYSLERREGYAVVFNTHPLLDGPSLSHVGGLVEDHFFTGVNRQSPGIPSDQEHGDIEGHYVYQNPRFRLGEPFEVVFGSVDVSWNGGTLHVAPFLQQAIKYVPEKPSQFRRRWELKPSLIFGRDEDGRPYMFQLINRYYLKSHAWVTIAKGAAIILGILGFMAGLIVPIARLFRDRKIGWAMCSLLASFSLIITLVAVAFFRTSQIATSPNLATWTAFFASIGMGLFSALALLGGISRWYSRSKDRFLLGIAGTQLGFCIYIGYYGWIGLRLF